MAIGIQSKIFAIGLEVDFDAIFIGKTLIGFAPPSPKVHSIFPPSHKHFAKIILFKIKRLNIKKIYNNIYINAIKITNNIESIFTND